MTHYARLRPRLSRLTLPLLWLAVICAVTSFFSVYELGDWVRYSLWTTAVVAAAILWLIPAMKFAGTFVDVKSTGLVISNGISSRRRREIAWTEIASVNYSAMRGVVVVTKDETEYLLRGYANQKLITAQLQTLLRGK